jgi:beta-carotene 3-hydroxylase
VTWQLGLPVALVTVLAMEGLAWAVHRYVMHGFGWVWHRSHHEPHNGLLERNDRYGLIASAVAACCFIAGNAVLFWIGVGLAIYGVLYYVVHDGLVHQRWPFRLVPRHGYLRRLYQAHLLHHATAGRDGAVSFGFLYAPPIAALRRRLQATPTLPPHGVARAAPPSPARAAGPGAVAAPRPGTQGRG